MKVAVGIGWFPAEEWEVALRRWPDLADENPTEHRDYVRHVEARLRQLSPPPGVILCPVAIDVAGLEGFAAEHAEELPAAGANSGEARSGYATHLLRDGGHRGWPPERNDPCWCRSGRKYKICCGTVRTSPAAATPSVPSTPAAEEGS